MSERYTKLFTLSATQLDAALHSPVEIAAGALLRDNQNDVVLAQIKYKNISSKSIKALTLNVNAYDKSGAKISGVSNFCYEGLIAGTGDFFGDKTPIFMTDNNTASFNVDVTMVEFSDGTSWSKFNQQVSETAKAAVKTAIEVGGKAAKAVGVPDVETAKAVGVKAAKTTVKTSAVIINTIFTIALVCGEVSIVKDLMVAPSARLWIAGIILGLATIVSAPGFAKIVFRGNYGKKQRLIKWGIFAGLILLDIIIMAVFF